MSDLAELRAVGMEIAAAHYAPDFARWKADQLWQYAAVAKAVLHFQDQRNQQLEEAISYCSGACGHVLDG